MVIKKQLGLRILSWNCNVILHGTRELDLANLVTANNVDVVALSEAEVPVREAQFTLDSFTTFCPLVKPGKKTRVMLLVKTDVAVKTNARLANEYLSDEFPSVWVQLDSQAMHNGDRTALCGSVLLCAVYRRWGSLTSEKSELEILKEQFLRASA
jgi:exonuclease III